jgi:hypothetical protein
MTAVRFRECLASLGLTTNDLARSLECSDRMTRRWASGRAEVPAGICRWLEAWVAVRQAHPDPAPPQDWHRSEA